jgi:phage/plasmid-like protein (TIGR03299 family)
MAHLIDETTGKAGIAYVGQVPWHGLGQELTPNAPIETWIREACLDWSIESAPVMFELPSGEQVQIDNRRALYRSDTGLYLSTMSKNHYKVVQPAEILEFYRDLVGDNGNFQLETAGSIDAGKKIWALAKYKDDIDLSGDIIKPYLMLATSCDGSMATTASFTTVRVVCNNTLQFSLERDAATSLKVGHRRAFDGESIKRELGLIEHVDRDFAAEMQALCDKKITEKQAKEFFAETYVRRDDKGNVKNERFVQLTTDKLMEILRNGPGAKLETANETAWGVVNAVTHFEDFHRRVNDSSNEVNNRFKSSQFGDGANRKAKILELIAA